MSKKQIFVVVLVAIVGALGIVVGYFASRFSQNPSTSAAEEQVLPGIPAFNQELGNDVPGSFPIEEIPPSGVKGDFNGDGAVSSADESLFMTKYQSKDASADLDGSGQVNTLDVAAFRQLLK